MERRVKERLIGAAILVAIVVLVVPALLSGAGPHAPPAAPPALPVTGVGAPMRTVRVDLAKSAPPAPQAPASTPAAPSAAAPRAAAPRAAAAPARLESADSSPISATSRPRPAARAFAPRGAWAVQLGSFSSKANAQKLSRKWRARGYAVFILSSGRGSKSLQHVRVGPYANRAAAQGAAATLKREGQAATVVAPPR
ncbi:MAG TPA: SPOR domain-containing protein [Steroidobacteraceae bacterium]|nr:SPOR domain-containing protein [Steroidobacteraceae bacterium]